MTKYTLILVVTTGLFASCEKDHGPYIVEDFSEVDSMVNLPPAPVTPTVFSYTIFFGTDVKPLLQQNCVQACHNSSHPKLDLRPSVSYNQLLTDGLSAPYVNTVNPEQSIIYLHLTGIYTLMPEGGPALSQGKIDSIYTWISQGALNN